MFSRPVQGADKPDKISGQTKLNDFSGKTLADNLDKFEFVQQSTTRTIPTTL
jgi:hypothetical protein